MTVIAWDGKTLAADKRSVIGSTVKTVTKIARVRGHLTAISGDFARGLELRAWFAGGAVPAEFPVKRNDWQGNLLVIDPQGRAWRYEESPFAFQFHDPFASAGSGEEGALIAMACGKSAIEAVEIVCRFNNGCGNGIDVLTLGD